MPNVFRKTINECFLIIVLLWNICNDFGDATKKLIKPNIRNLGAQIAIVFKKNLTNNWEIDLIILFF
jgi:hypothetical protein